MSSENVADSFHRQRRNLMMISLVLIVYDWAQISITSITSNGSNISIGNTDAIIPILWIMWGWWLLRYYIYFHDIEAVVSTRNQIDARYTFYIKQDSVRLLNRYWWGMNKPENSRSDILQASFDNELVFLRGRVGGKSIRFVGVEYQYKYFDPIDKSSGEMT